MTRLPVPASLVGPAGKLVQMPGANFHKALKLLMNRDRTPAKP
jgi:hypothetical protein